MKTELVKSQVVFDEMSHTYTAPDGRQLSGVTALLNRQMFERKYDGVSPEVLARAAAYGSNIHERIELHDTLGFDGTDDPVITAYEKIKKENGLVTISNEYLVSDGVVASSIDILFEGYDLCDAKTTSSLDKEYVSWQLSIYAYLFEQQNPGLKAGRLWALWLPRPQYGSPSLVEVPRIPAEEIKALIEADMRGEKFVPTIHPARIENRIDLAQSAIDEVVAIERSLAELKQKREQLQSGLLSLMKQSNVKSFKCDTLQLIVKAESTRVDIDKKILKEKYPAIYAECSKTITIKESLTIKTL